MTVLLMSWNLSRLLDDIDDDDRTSLMRCILPEDAHVADVFPTDGLMDLPSTEKTSPLSVQLRCRPVLMQESVSFVVVVLLWSRGRRRDKQWPLMLLSDRAFTDEF